MFDVWIGGSGLVKLFSALVWLGMMILCMLGLAALITILWGAMGGLDWIGEGELGGGVHGFVIAWMIIVGLKDLMVFGDPGGGVGGGVLMI